MEIKASLKYLRTSARKVRLLADLVRGLNTSDALNQLKFANKRAADPVSKLLKSAMANAVNNFELDENNLFIKEIKVNEGSTLKRWMPRAHGRATTIRKRSCHIHVILGEIKESGKKEAKKQKIEAPVKLDELAKGFDKTKKPTKKTVKKDKKITKEDSAEKGSEIIDPRLEGRGGHAKAEGGNKGFSRNIFRRKSG